MCLNLLPMCKFQVIRARPAGPICAWDQFNFSLDVFGYYANLRKAGSGAFFHPGRK